jgi:hypothetical protein
MTNEEQEAAIVGTDQDRLDHVLQENDLDFWDIEQTRRDGTEIKIRVKELTTRDGLKQEQLRMNLMKRLGVSKKRNLDKDLTTMTLVQHYPLIRFGTEATIGIDIPQTEEAFWNIPEYIMLIWSEAVIEANPQYAVPFVEVRKLLENLTKAQQKDE